MIKYGSGYNFNWDSWELSLKQGFREALQDMCETLCDTITDMIRSGIYSGMPIYYNRTYEMQNMQHYMTYEIFDLTAHFYFDDKEFNTLSIDNPPHHQYNGNGEEFMAYYISPEHDDFMSDVMSYIDSNKARLYRKSCKKLGLHLY
jgi:hypothetical protein